MKIGFGQADITPRGGKAYLIGQFNERVTDQVNDALRTVVMLIESDSARTLWVSADTLWINEGARDLAFAAVKEVIPALKNEEFVLSATHIHTGPALWADTWLCLTADRAEPEGALTAAECAAQFAAAVAEAASEAQARLAEARVELAIAPVQTGVNRRVVFKDGHAEMYGDPLRPDFLRMEGRDGGPVQLLYVYHQETNALCGVVANPPCTAQCDEHAEYITSDYWGVTRDILAQQLGEHVYILPLCRAAGDLSPHHLVDGYHEYRKAFRYHGRQRALDMGAEMADTILRHQKRILKVYGSDAVHAQGMRLVDFPVWQPTDEEYAWACDFLAGEHPGPSMDKSRAFGIRERRERHQAVYPCPIFAARLGDIVLISNPFELFIEYADRIRMALHDSVVFDVQLTHGCMGYLATPRAIEGGSYSAMLFNSVCGPEGGEALVEGSIALAKELMNQ